MNILHDRHFASIRSERDWRQAQVKLREANQALVDMRRLGPTMRLQGVRRHANFLLHIPGIGVGFRLLSQDSLVVGDLNKEEVRSQPFSARQWRHKVALGQRIICPAQPTAFEIASGASAYLELMLPSHMGDLSAKLPKAYVIINGHTSDVENLRLRNIATIHLPILDPRAVLAGRIATGE